MIAFALQAAGMLLAGAVAVRFLRSKSASLRHTVWSLTLAATLVLPLLSPALAGHGLELRLPATAAKVMEPPFGDFAPQRSRASRSVLLPDPLASLTTSPVAVRTLLGIWLLGTSILLARCAHGRLALRRLGRRARPVTGVQDLLAEGAAMLDCRRRVRLLTDVSVPTPAAFGLLRSAIVLPAGWEEWPPARMRAVLLHELAHVARFDAVPQLLAEVVRAIHWFNPLAWYAARGLAQERERACDDAVLGAGVGARDYAASILEAAREMPARPALAGALPIVHGTAYSALEARLVAILDPAVPRGRTGWTQRLRLALLAAGFAIVLAGLHIAPAAAFWNRAVSLDDPRSEIVPAVGSEETALPEASLRNDAERSAFHRLRTAAAHVKTWEGDLVRERAAWALRQVRDGEVVPPLLRALSDSDWRVQAYAAWALGTAGDARAIEPLRPLLTHTVWRVRSQALYSLLDLDADLPSPRLAALAADPAWQVRIGVVEYWARRPGPEALAGLHALAADPHTGTRMTAQDALAQREPGAP